VVTLALAFLLGSFAARNPDLWLHLADGRQIVAGGYRFGGDPFTYTCAETRWINPAWLWDVTHYGLLTAGGGEDRAGGAVLVIFKALLVTLLAGVLIATRRRDLGLWAPAGCTALAVLVMSPRLLLQPAVVSFLFLALTVYLLQRARAAGDSAAARWFRWTHGRAWVLLPPLFALWANLDEWFWLGPITVFLYLGGEALQCYATPGQSAEGTPRPRDLATLAVVGLVGLAACVLNPYGPGIYTTLPSEVAIFGMDESVRGDVAFKGYASFRPFSDLLDLLQNGHSDHLGRANAYGNIAGWSYFVLLVLGVTSFVLNLEGWTWWRALLWVAFAALSVFQARAIPFFVVVAGPVTALNLQDFAVRRFGAVPRTDASWPIWLLGGRVLTLLVGVFLLLLAWPGWLHSAPFVEARSGRRVAWAVHPDPSLKAAALKVRELRNLRELGPEDRGFNFTPDLAGYWAWYCPEERGFFDYRFQLSPETARTYVEIRKALAGFLPTVEEPNAAADWPKLEATYGLENYRIRYLALHQQDPAAMGLSLRLWLDPATRAHWTVVYNDGQSAVLGYDPAGKGRDGPFANSRLDPEQRAFGSAAERIPDPPGEPRAPEAGEWYEHWLKALGPRPAGADEANLYLSYYRLVGGQWDQERGIAAERARRWALTYLKTHRFGFEAASPSPVGLLLDYWVVSPVAMSRVEPWALQNELAKAKAPRDLGPPAALLLAIRAARRAIAANPDDPDAYFRLATAYQLLAQQEDLWDQRPVDPQTRRRLPTPRSSLREAQEATALQHLLTLRPDNWQAHRRLAELCRQRDYLDMAVDHYQEALKHLEETSRNLPETEDAVSRSQVERLKAILKDLEPILQDRKDRYSNEAKNQPARVKFFIAQALGLAQLGQNILEEVQPAELKKEETQALTDRLLELYYLTGQVDKARPRVSVNDFYLFRIAAVDGYYGDAGKRLGAWIDQQQEQRMHMLAKRLQLQAFGDRRSGMSLLSLGDMSIQVAGLSEVAEYRVVRGLLALEEGDVQTAREQFEKALHIGFPWKPLFASFLTPLAADSVLSEIAFFSPAPHRQKPFHFISEPTAAHYLRPLRTAK
jgi:hypothetical protein